MTINNPPVDERGFVQLYLEFYNKLIPESQRLMPSEIDLVTEFAILPEDKFAYQRFSSLAKSKVVESAKSRGWKLTKLNINNKIYSLLDPTKKFLRRDEDGVIYLPKHLLQALQEFRKNKSFEIRINFKLDVNGITQDNPNSKSDSTGD